MPTAFAWLDAHMIEALDAPDEHFDWITMAKEADWAALVAAYPSRPAEWREALALVVSEAPPRWGYELLALALCDPEPAVRAQAGLAFVDLFDANEDEGADAITEAIWSDLRKVAEDPDESIDDVRAFLARRPRP